ncbi:hypothetical protein PINS_up019299 [Pythium insidiosum]|nr:hypothetical protein PINS_up019299 [Pythium insidiosum]
MSRHAVERYRGCLALRVGVGSDAAREIDAMIDRYEAQQGRSISRTSADEWHITLLTKDELRQLPDPQQVQQRATQALATRFFPIGLGTCGASGVFFVVCVWPRAQIFRQELGLPLKDCHVTVTHANDHTIDKTFTAVIDPAAASRELAMEPLEALARQLLLEGQSELALSVAVELCTRFPDATQRGWLRLGDAALACHKPKLASLCFARRLGQGAEITEDVVRYCRDRFAKCASSGIEWGLLFREPEIEELPTQLHSALLTAWTPLACRTAQDAAASVLVPPETREPRERLFTRAIGPSPRFFRLPRFFRWIVPFHLAAMSTPKNAVDVEHLALSVGIRHIVTLTEEERLPTEWITACPSVENTFLPVTNYEAPSMEQIDLFISLCLPEDGARGPVLVHCGGGKGRAGTMVACYLVAFGFRPPPRALGDWEQPAMNAAEAIQALRAMRPGSIETKVQEDAVSAYCSLLWKRRSLLPAVVSEPPISAPEYEGEPVERSDLLVLCGLPGAGKTSFRKALLKRSLAAMGSTRNDSTALWTVLSGDEHGRQGCERSIGASGLRRAILDRCNGDIADRHTFLSLASTWSRHATAVWFDFSVELCTARAQRRADHPTLPPGGRVRTAIASHHKQFTAPTLREGFRTVVRLTSIEAVMQLVDRLSPPLGLLKFPRTAHLFNLGAATPDDLVMDTLPQVLPPSSSSSSSSNAATEVVVTEKLDGANMGISLDASGYGLVVQNRSHYISSASQQQFRRLDAFLARHRDELLGVLRRDPLFPQRYILYGEWLAATHSVAYTRLESLFYAFDLFDRQRQCFVDRQQLEFVLREVSFPLVPVIWRGAVLPSKEELVRMAHRDSICGDPGATRAEGLLVKWERDGVVLERAKVVRPDFIAGNEHWSRGPLQLNTVISTLC